MTTIGSVRPFTNEQLGILEASLDPMLVFRAVESSFVRELSEANQLIKDMAALHVFGKVVLARGRLLDFEFSMTLGHDMSAFHPDLQWHSPAERAGTAAGQLAIAKLLTKWYGLEQQDFTKLPQPQDTLGFIAMQVEDLEQAICTTPQTLGLTPFTARDVYLETRFSAQAAVSKYGPEALEPYMAFDAFPTWASTVAR